MLLQKKKSTCIYTDVLKHTEMLEVALWLLENETASSLFPQFISASSKVGCHSGCSLPHPNGLHSRFAETSSFNQALILLTFLAELLERNSSWQLQRLCSLVYQAAAEWDRQAHHFCAAAAAENSDKAQAGQGKALSFSNVFWKERIERQEVLRQKHGLQEPRQITDMLLLLGSQARKKFFSFSLC